MTTPVFPGSSLALSVTVTGPGFSDTYVPPQLPLTNTTPPGNVPTNLALSTGNNTVTIPAGTNRIMLVDPPGSTNAKTLKGVAGDSGIALRPGDVHVFGVTSSQASFVVNAAAPETIAVAFF